MARKRFNFWLDDKRADDWHVNDLITTLKAAGQFTRAIREGLRLWVDLRAGNTSVLIELFPAFKDKLNPPASTPTNGAGGSDLAKEIAAQIILQGGTPGYLMQSTAQPAPQPAPTPATTGKLLSGFKPLVPPPPVEDDLDDLLEFTASTQRTASDNFMRMLGSLS